MAKKTDIKPKPFNDVECIQPLPYKLRTQSQVEYVNSEVTISVVTMEIWQLSKQTNKQVEFYDEIEPDFNVSRDLHV